MLKRTNLHYLISLLLCCSQVSDILAQTNQLIVNTTLGEIQGITQSSQSGSMFYAYRGIPYAKPPVGLLRFAAPEAIEPWTNVLQATKDAPLCPQRGNLQPMSEDCLYINVFSKNVSSDAALPVIVYIHGGGNMVGSSHSEYYSGPQYLMDHDIVLVSFNYRLGALGFLSTRTQEAAGNFGYLDQVLALKWVQQHIHNFGGNASRVTISGFSAGAMAVTLHMASPLSVGLFNAAIAMSGSASNHYAVDNVFWTRKLAREVSCPLYGAKNIVDCLRNVSWEKIAETCGKWELWEFVNLKWNYEVDGHFLTHHPTHAFLNGNFSKVPIVAGIAQNELDFGLYQHENNTALLSDFEQNFNFYAPELFLYNETENALKSEQLWQFYIGNTNQTSLGVEPNIVNFGSIFSDAIIGHGVHRLVQLISSQTPVYYYLMDYVGQRSLSLDHAGKPRGVEHGDSFSYVMPDRQLPQIQNNHPDIFMVNRMTQLWATFARDGKPSINDGNFEWIAFTPTNESVLYINANLTLGPPPFVKRYELWNQLFPYASSSGILKISSLFITMTIVIANLLC